jgi:protein involved in polysaccharide export with SLBB domain
MRHLFRMIALAAPWALAGAACAAPDPGDQPGPERTPSYVPFPLASVVGDDYVLQPQDLVSVELVNEPDTATEQRISGQGEVRLPMLGVVHLQGATVRGAEAQLEKLYKSGGYYKDPQVILYVSEHSERTISVLGQVNRPDRIALATGTDSMGLSQAVAIVGGLTRIAKSSAVQVSRRGPDGRDQRFEVNLDAYLHAGKSAPPSDFRLLPDDVVFVPERTI